MLHVKTMVVFQQILTLLALLTPSWVASILWKETTLCLVLLLIFNTQQPQSLFPIRVIFWLLNRHASLPPVLQNTEKPEQSVEFNFQGCSLFKK